MMQTPKPDTQSIPNEATDGPTPDEVAALHRGLAEDPPRLAPKYFYDAHGSALFEAITHTPEYYPTRIETEILTRHADDVMAAGPWHEVAELGSGAGVKIRRLIEAGQRAGSLRRCVMLDISKAPLDRSVRELRRVYDGLEIRGIVGDFNVDLARLGPGSHRLILFLAGTVGNFTRDEAAGFLTMVRDGMDDTDGLLLGVDLVKDTPTLQAAYNDKAGITAAFNRNILTVINRRFGANFELENWEHVALYDERQARIEMRLRSRKSHDVQVEQQSYHFAKGAELLTEISCKYSRKSLSHTLLGTGLAVTAWWTDAAQRFGVALLRPAS